MHLCSKYPLPKAMKKILLLFLILFPAFAMAQTDSLPTFNLPPSYMEYSDGTPRELTFSDRREPFLAGFLSYLMPGGGQLYNKDYEKALGIWTTMACAVVFGYQYERTNNSVIGENIIGLGLSGAWIYSFFDAIFTAKKINKALDFQIKRTASFSLKPDLQLARNPYSIGLSKPEAVVGLRLKVSL